MTNDDKIFYSINKKSYQIDHRCLIINNLICLLTLFSFLSNIQIDIFAALVIKRSILFK